LGSGVEFHSGHWDETPNMQADTLFLYKKKKTNRSIYFNCPFLDLSLVKAQKEGDLLLLEHVFFNF
jgi:hypothetical protein